MSASNQTYYALILPQLQSVYKTMCFYVPVIILMPGLVLNMFMVFVFASRKRFWNQTTMGFYYSLASVFSSLIIVIGLINFLPVAFGQDLTLTSVEACRAIWYFRLFIYLPSSYFQVQISIDRTLNVLYPRRFIWLTKPTNLVKITCGIFSFFAVYCSIQLFRFFTYKTITDSNGKNKTIPASCILTDQIVIGLSISNFIIRVVDYSAKIVCNFLIIYKLKSTRRKLTRDSTTSSSGMSRKELAFAVSLTSGNFVQLIMVSPFLSILIVQLTYALTPKATSDFTAFANQLYAITNFGNYAYEAFQFPVAVATNKIFRSELMNMIKGLKGSDATTQGSLVTPNQRQSRV